MVGRGGAQSHAGQGGLLRRRQGIAYGLKTAESEALALDSGVCTTIMAELLVESTDGVVRRHLRSYGLRQGKKYDTRALLGRG